MSSMFKPKIPKSAPPISPNTQKIEPPKKELGDEKDELQRRQKGRSSLRIDPQTGGGGASKTGINLPMK